jgi:hypothetical protein
VCLAGLDPGAWNVLSELESRKNHLSRATVVMHDRFGRFGAVQAPVDRRTVHSLVGCIRTIVRNRAILDLYLDVVVHLRCTGGSRDTHGRTRITQSNLTTIQT